MKPLIKDANPETLNALFSAARTEAMANFNGTLNSINVDNSITAYNSEMHSIIYKSSDIVSFMQATMKTFIKAADIFGLYKALQFIQETWFLAGFNYACYLAEQRELEEINQKVDPRM